MKKYFIVSAFLLGTSASFASSVLVDTERFESRSSVHYVHSHYSSSSHSVVKEKKYEDFELELTQKFRSSVVGALNGGGSFSFLLNDEFRKKEYVHVKETVRNAIDVLGTSFFKEAQLGMHEKSVNDFMGSMTRKWNFVELTDFQTNDRLKNTQRIFAHPEGLVVRFKEDGSTAFSVYTAEDTKNVQAFINDPRSRESRRLLSSTFNQKANAEACKLFVGYGENLPFENDYIGTGIIVEPVPNSPGNSIGLRRFLGNDKYSAIPEGFRVFLQKHLDNMTMNLGHLKYKSGNLFPDKMQLDFDESFEEKGKKRKRSDSNDHYGEEYPSSKRIKRN